MSLLGIPPELIYSAPGKNRSFSSSLLCWQRKKWGEAPVKGCPISVSCSPCWRSSVTRLLGSQLNLSKPEVRLLKSTDWDRVKGPTL